MRLISSTSFSSSTQRFPLLCPQNHNNRVVPSNFPCFCSKQTLPVSLHQKPPVVQSEEPPRGSQLSQDRDSSKQVLVVRRPILEVSKEEEDDDENDNEMSVSSTLIEKFAKKLPIFEPERVEGNANSSKDLVVNLDLALYKVKVLARSFRYDEAEAILTKCISRWPEDGRPYVALGKILGKQSKSAEARAIYEKGCQATQGENPYIWQCWAVLENKLGNIRRARQLFDAATVADKSHAAGWHGWAVLEIKQGNVKKARQLLAKGLKFGGKNEYIYHTLALLEAKANRYEQASYLFREATKCNPRSCACWLAWAQLEMQQEHYLAARQLFQKAVDASPRNRFAWHVWGVSEASMGNVEMARKLLKIGHVLNPRDPVLLQSLALLEYEHSSADLARAVFRRASEVGPSDQSVWFAWGWMEWKENNLDTARKLYQKVLSIDPTNDSAARCLQAWGVLEQRLGNYSAARRLFRSSLNINSQSYVTWMTWAQFEEDQGNVIRAEEIRNLYFQQRTQVVDDASWVMGFMNIIHPAVDGIKRLLNLVPKRTLESLTSNSRTDGNTGDYKSVDTSENGNAMYNGTRFDIDSFIKERLSLDSTKLDVQLQPSGSLNGDTGVGEKNMEVREEK